MTVQDLVTVTAAGLYCPAGGFHIDPTGPVALAVVTHAHADHARPGCGHYLAAASGAGLLRKRLGADAVIATYPYGEMFALGAARVTLFPAGHVLGSAQVRIEVDGRIWVVSGDYKRAADPTCLALQPVPCDVFVTEATFAKPIFRWPTTATVIDDILQWWSDNASAGRASVLFCYALGKAQRVLAELHGRIDTPILVHGAVEKLNRVYRTAGIALAPTRRIDNPPPRSRSGDFAGRLILAPPGAAATPWMRRFGAAATGFCSGWMAVPGQRRQRGVERGFVLSDHADWDDLLDTIRSTGAHRVLTHHGYAQALANYLDEAGIDAGALPSA